MALWPKRFSTEKCTRARSSEVLSKYGGADWKAAKSNSAHGWPVRSKIRLDSIRLRLRYPRTAMRVKLNTARLATGWPKTRAGLKTLFNRRLFNCACTSGVTGPETTL